VLLDLFILLVKQLHISLEEILGWKTVYRDWYLNRIANDEFIRYENHHFRALKKTLPMGRYEDEDIKLMIRAWACEAAHRYDPTANTKFCAFLYTHLMHRCKQAFATAWRNYPENQKWLKNDTSWVFEGPPTEVPPIDVDEVMERLTPKSREVFGVLSKDEHLINLAKNPVNRYRIADRTGIPREVLDHMFEEVVIAGRDWA
jgi:hypothetical protein